MRWTAAGRFASQLVTWAITLIVIRLLSPEDYGLMAMATAVIGLCYLINELGVIPALIQTKDVDDYLIRQVFGVILLSNAAILAIIVLGAPLYASFFEEPRLVPILHVLGVSLMVMAWGAVPKAVLMRDIEFKQISIIEFGSTIASSFVTLALALYGAGVWALVAGNLTIMVVRTIGIVVATGFWMAPVFRFGGMGRLFSYGAKVSLQRIIWYVGQQLDVILIGKLLGNAPLGIYSVGYHLATLPMQRVMGIVNQVAFPAYSRIQDDLPRVKSYFLETTKLISLVFFPIMWGLSSVSDEMVAVFLGDKWVEAGFVLQVICLGIPLRVTSFLISPLVDALGRPGMNAANVAIGIVIFACCIVISMDWGLHGVVVGIASAYVLTWYVVASRCLPLIGASVWELLAAMVPALWAACVMYAAVYVVDTMFAVDLVPMARLGLLVTVGALTYGSITWMFNRETVRQAWGLIVSRG